VDSARANLASTFVNAFVNAGFGQDKLVTAQVEDEKVGGAAASPARPWPPGPSLDVWGPAAGLPR
jgi:hypothetical protein